MLVFAIVLVAALAISYFWGSNYISQSALKVAKKLSRVLQASILMVMASFIVCADEVHTGGKVCGNPSAPCQSTKGTFSANDLSFSLPAKLRWLNNYYSADFYAIILKSKQAVPDPDGPAGPAECSSFFSERERLEAQSLFPRQKVFASRFGCGSPGVGYTNVNYNFNFLAVYGGETKAAADSLLARLKASGKFPGANIRKMQVVVDYGD